MPMLRAMKQYPCTNNRCSRLSPGIARFLHSALQVFHHTRLRQHFGVGHLDAAYKKHPWVLGAVLHGWVGVDVLFLLMAFYGTLSLLPALEDPRQRTLQARSPAAAYCSCMHTCYTHPA